MPGRVANKQEWLETPSSAQGALAADETIIIQELATRRQLHDSRASDSGGGLTKTRTFPRERTRRLFGRIAYELQPAGPP